jgi:hypothetical protein
MHIDNSDPARSRLNDPDFEGYRPPRPNPEDTQPGRLPRNDLFDSNFRTPRPDPEPMPGFEDEFELGGPRPLFPRPSGNPLSIGHDDLNPPGLFNPIHGGLGPTGLPQPGAAGRGGQGGMYMDIRSRGRPNQSPPPGVPPGARWDPIGPGRRRGGGPNPFGGFGDDDFI